MSIRESIIAEIRLLSLPSEQLAYEQSLTQSGHAPSELIDGFCSDLYNPKNEELISSFSKDELKELAHLYGIMVEASQENSQSVASMLKSPTWRRVIELAKELYSFYERQGT